MRPDGVSDMMAFQRTSHQKAHHSGQPAGDPFPPHRFTVSASVGGVVVAEREFIRRMMSPDVSVESVRHGRLRGIAYSAAGPAPSKGAIMMVSGSDGGVESRFAPLLASAGYDVFCLAYFNWTDLPGTIDRIELEYFEEGFLWMRKRFGWPVAAVQGPSRGGELALLLAAVFPQFVAGVTAIVPNSHAFAGWNATEFFTGPAWTFEGANIPFLPLAKLATENNRRRPGRCAAV